MATNSNDPYLQQANNAGILHLENTGYGPEGLHKRWEWRKECLDNLVAGKEVFKSWQLSWLNKVVVDTTVSMACNLIPASRTILIEDNKFAPWILDYSNHTFESSLNLDGFEFLGPVLFANAKFQDKAMFNGTKFKHDAWFEDTVFNGFTTFFKAEFGFSAQFSCAIFKRDCYFTVAKFEGLTTYIGCSFEGVADFQNAKFESLGNFQKSKFLTHIPSFRSCQIDRTFLDFNGSEFPSLNNLNNPNPAISDISFLKRLSDEHGQTDQALMFNAMELNAKRAQVRSNTQHLCFKQKLFNSDYWFANATALYEQFSDYGRSYTKPLKWYLILLLFTLWLALANSIIFSAKKCENETWYLFTNLNREQIECLPKKLKEGEKPFKLTAWRAASEYTLYRAAGVLDFSDSDKQTKEVAHRLFDQEIEPWWMRIWGIFKAIASTALLFLAALGLRNKYRIK